MYITILSKRSDPKIIMHKIVCGGTHVFVVYFFDLRTFAMYYVGKLTLYFMFELAFIIYYVRTCTLL